MIKRLILSGFLVCLQYHFVFAQDKYAFSNKIVNFQFLYNYQIPSGDFGKLYNNFSSVGFGGLLKTKQNWIFSGEINYLFGKEIKDEHILDKLVNGGGYIASATGAPADYSVGMRGFEGFVKAGRLFAINKYNMNCGFILLGGVGFIQHYINFVFQSENEIPQLDKNYQKGYDRFTEGIAFNQFAGYYFHSKNRLINFYVGVDFTEGFTKNKRGYNYDKMAFDKNAKQDYVTSFRAGWMIPIYLNTKEENEFQFR
ncbi:MAG: hypothetical protein Q8M15_09730 [Bacteroidota bacterium]|nr:hypothetical protein [Bacteroidota bacterium]